MPKNPRFLWVVSFILLAVLNAVAIFTAVIFAHSLDSAGPGPLLKILGSISFLITLPYFSFSSFGSVGVFAAFIVVVAFEATMLFLVLLVRQLYQSGSSHSNRKS